MEISAIAKAASNTLEKQAESINPDKILVDKFSQLMKQRVNEASTISELVDFPSSSISFGGTSPQQAIENQKLITRALVEVDLAAKTAGSFSQSINKLVTMQ